MNRRLPAGLNLMALLIMGNMLFGIIVSLVVCGCQSEPTIVKQIVEVPVPDIQMPLTMGILRRLSTSHEGMVANIDKFQLVLSGRVSLERDYLESNDIVEERGRARLVDVHIRESITIPDQTEGLALRYTEEGDEVLLYLCFESNKDNTILFSAKNDNSGEYFYLKVDTDNTVLLGEERGTITYGGQQYKVKYNGNVPPYLLIKLSQVDRERGTSRALEGRRVPYSPSGVSRR